MLSGWTKANNLDVENLVGWITWEKPPTGYLKCNVDASFNQVSGMTGFGMCLRDHVGGFIFAKTTCISPVLQVHEGEAAGLLEALRWLQHLGFDHVILESDCKHLVDNIERGDTHVSDVWILGSSLQGHLICF